MKLTKKNVSENNLILLQNPQVSALILTELTNICTCSGVSTEPLVHTV